MMIDPKMLSLYWLAFALAVTLVVVLIGGVIRWIDLRRMRNLERIEQRRQDEAEV